MQTYTPLPVTFTHGDGAWLWDSEGNQYLDALSGIAVSGLGHAHPTLFKAIAEQASRLLHVSNWYHIQEQKQLGESLCRLSGMDNVFFGNSGAEANEAAIKIARLYGHNQGLSSPKIITMKGSFHGRTMATLSATGNAKIQAGFEPLLDGFIHVPYNDLTALENAAKEHQDIVAVLLEPVQGEGGINIPASDYLPGIRKLCDEHNWLMMLDEIQSGMARTGRWFAFQHYDLQPDVMTLAKALGNGIPIGACLARGKAAEVFSPGKHGSTFGGNPFSCKAAQAVVDAITEERLDRNAEQLGNYLLTGFQEQLSGLAGVQEIRGHGLMLGIELEKPCAELMQAALEEKILINVTADKVVRLLPPLILNKKQADQIISRVSTLIKAFLN